MKKAGLIWAILLVAFGVANGPSLVAAQPGDLTEEERRKQEIDRIKAETELLKERTNLEKATSDRLKALIPSFAGNATTDANAGRLEGSMLSTQAVSLVSQLIVGRLSGLDASESRSDAPPRNICGLPAGPVQASVRNADGRPPARFIVLAGTEGFDLGVVDFVRGQMVAICTQLLTELPSGNAERVWLTTAESNDRSELIGGLSVPIQVATALFGALRSDVNITTIETPGISVQLLARGVAEHLGNRAILGTEPTIAPGNRVIRSDSIEGLFAQLYLIRARAERHRDSDAMKGDANMPQRDRITALINRFDSFATAITTPDAQGNLMVARAARLERLMAANDAGVRPHIMRVYLDQSGGSLIRTTNIGTFIGIDPLRISGGLVASFTVTHAETGEVLKAGVFACRTGLMRLRRVHDGTWGQMRAAGRAAPAPVCVPRS